LLPLSERSALPPCPPPVPMRRPDPTRSFKVVPQPQAPRCVWHETGEQDPTRRSPCKVVVCGSTLMPWSTANNSAAHLGALRELPSPAYCTTPLHFMTTTTTRRSYDTKPSKLDTTRSVLGRRLSKPQNRSDPSPPLHRAPFMRLFSADTPRG
jgi:hypothetical protein